MNIILAQIMALFVLSFIFMGTQAVNKKYIFIYNGLSNIFWGIQYLLLGGLTGSISCIVAILRNIIFYKYKKPSFFILIIFLILLLIVNIPFIDGYLSILPLINVFIFTYALWSSDVKIIKISCVITGIVGIVYDIGCMAYADIVVQSIDLIGGFIGYLKIVNKKSV